MGSAEHPLSRLRTRVLRCASVWRHLMHPGGPGSRAGLCRDKLGAPWAGGCCTGSRGTGGRRVLGLGEKNALDLSSIHLPLLFQALPKTKQHQAMKRGFVGLRFVGY